MMTMAEAPARTALGLTYARLAAPFEVTFTDVRGGVQLTYISGEQVVRRLNEVLGVGGWSFRVLRHDINPEADEAWALGELVARHRRAHGGPSAVRFAEAQALAQHRRAAGYRLRSQGRGDRCDEEVRQSARRGAVSESQGSAAAARPGMKGRQAMDGVIG